MAIYDAGTASLASNGTVSGSGTTWQAPLTLIRVGATIVFKTEPVQIYTISEIISDNQISVYNPNNETAPAGTGYAILAHDGITVQGLAQDVAETLRYYQSQESYVAKAVDAFANFDAADFDTKVTQVNTQHGEVVTIGAQVSADAAQVTNDKNAAAASAASASSDKDAASASAQEAADYAASLNTQNLLRKDLNFSDIADKSLARTNIDVYSKSEVDQIGYGYTYSEIRNLNTAKQVVRCSGAFNAGDGGDGIFSLDANDTTSTDNSGTILVTNSGLRYKRIFDGRVNVKWFTGQVGSSVDASVGIQRCVNSYPYSEILFPKDNSGYYMKSSVVEPQSASYQLIGDDGIQVNNQTLIYVDFNGPAFYSGEEKTTFTKYRGFRFETNKGEYPLSQAIRNNGFLVHGEIKNCIFKYFNIPPVDLNGYNACNFEHVIFQDNESWGMTCKAGASNTFIRVIGDNNNGGVFSVSGASNNFFGCYSEDCCKRNVTNGESNPEFLFSGDSNTAINFSINSYPGNSTPPVRLDFARNMTMIGWSNKSTVTPSYTNTVILTNQDSSLTLINSSDITIARGSDAKNTIRFDAGYSAASSPSIIVGGFGRDLVKNTPICTASFNGVNGAIFEANGLASIERLSVGTYKINMAESVSYTNGIRTFGGANSDGLGNHITISEQVSQRTSSSVVIVASNDSGVTVDPYQVSVSILGSV